MNFLSSLTKYKISDISVSGLSSGAYMAVQMHIAFSSIVNGSAIFAGGPFYCAESTLAYAESKCMDATLGGPDTEKLVSLTLTDEAMGYVDKVSNLKDDRVYLFSGEKDTVVKQAVMKELQTYYSHFVGANSIVADYHHAAEHCMPTVAYGSDCQLLASPYMGKCDFDGAGAAFSVLFTGLKDPVVAKSANLFSFSQTPYITSLKSSLSDVGYLYVPTACQSGSESCRLHISFHGCKQSLSMISSVYAQHAGFNEWAESNNIIVLYPYVEVSQANPLNPNGCWDWWAYTDVFYGVKTGVQMVFVRNLIKALSGI